MSRDSVQFLLLNIGHFLDHLFTLVFATVAALVLVREWGVPYGSLLHYATPGFVAFGLFSLPAGWLADKWSREGMMCVFFIGIGLASIVTSFAQSPIQIGIGLFVIGMFAAIYHPVGLAIVTAKWKKTGMRIAVNGVWGNLGVASAALLTGFLIDHAGWRWAFIIPGILSIGVGAMYFIVQAREVFNPAAETKSAPSGVMTAAQKAILLKVSAIVFATTAISSIIFQSTTFALPKIFSERLQGISETLVNWTQATGLSTESDIATMIGLFAFIVFTLASLAQLVVGYFLDIHGPRRVFLTVAGIQVTFFALMPGLQDGLALLVALGFMLGAFGQIPINDFMIGKMASGPARARIYGVRYVVSFSVLAASLPLIAFVYTNWGFDTLFWILAAAAAAIFSVVLALPAALPASNTVQPAAAAE